MFDRTKAKVIRIGDRCIGGDYPIAIQSMCNTKTEDVKATVAQILALEAAGCEIIRVAVPTMEAAEAITEIKKQIHIPLVADIHFDYRLAMASVENGADKIRINPGNIGSPERIQAVVDCCREKNIPIRIFGICFRASCKPCADHRRAGVIRVLFERLCAVINRSDHGNRKCCGGIGCVFIQW